MAGNWKHNRLCGPHHLPSVLTTSCKRCLLPATLCLRPFPGHERMPSPCAGQAWNAGQLITLGSSPSPVMQGNWWTNKPTASPLGWDNFQLCSLSSPRGPCSEGARLHSVVSNLLIRKSCAGLLPCHLIFLPSSSASWDCFLNKLLGLKS